MAAKVFISYRRADSAGYSGRVMDRLDRELGRDLVFMDVDAIPLGTNFSKVLHQEVAKCGVLLAGSVAYIEALFAQRMSYATAMALTAVTVFVGAILITALGREQRGIRFGRELTDSNLSRVPEVPE